MAKLLVPYVDIRLDLLTFQNIVVPTSIVSRINVLPSQLPCAMTFPSSSMKHPRCVNRICIPSWTIFPIDTRFFVFVGMCRTFINFLFFSEVVQGNCIDMLDSMFRRTLVFPVSPNTRTTPRGSSCDVTLQNQHTTPHLISRFLPSWNFLCALSQRSGPIHFRLPRSPRHSAVVADSRVQFFRIRIRICPYRCT